MTEPEKIDQVAAIGALAKFVAALTVGLVEKGVISDQEVSAFAKSAIASMPTGKDGARQIYGAMFLNLKLD